MASNPVVWFEIYVSDMNRARTFYEKVFAVPLQKLETGGIDMWAFPMQENGSGAGGALVHAEGVAPGGTCGTLVYFASEDCAVAAQRAREAGGRVVREKIPIGQYGFIVLLNDTEGNMIGVHSMK
jgi:predicted enzyme related to lactoylglutathione lyase